MKPHDILLIAAWFLQSELNNSQAKGQTSSEMNMLFAYETYRFLHAVISMSRNVAKKELNIWQNAWLVYTQKYVFSLQGWFGLRVQKFASL